MPALPPVLNRVGLQGEISGASTNQALPPFDATHRVSIESASPGAAAPFSGEMLAGAAIGQVTGRIVFTDQAGAPVTTCTAVSVNMITGNLP